jgi:hypothetical protein
MSKFDIGVGDEFPLDEGGGDRRAAWQRGRHGHHHHHHHRGPGLARFALLLAVAGVAALIVEHKLPAEAAYGMIALGLAALVIMFVRHWRHHRCMTQQVS